MGDDAVEVAAVVVVEGDKTKVLEWPPFLLVDKMLYDGGDDCDDKSAVDVEAKQETPCTRRNKRQTTTLPCLMVVQLMLESNLYS